MQVVLRESVVVIHNDTRHAKMTPRHNLRYHTIYAILEISAAKKAYPEYNLSGDFITQIIT